MRKYQLINMCFANKTASFLALNKTKQNKTKNNFLRKLFFTYRAKGCWLATKNISDKKDNKTLKRFFKFYVENKFKRYLTTLFA